MSRGWDIFKDMVLTKADVQAFKQRVERGMADLEKNQAQSIKIKAEVSAAEERLKNIEDELYKQFGVYESELGSQKKALKTDAENNRLKSAEIKAREDKLVAQEEAFNDKLEKTTARLTQKESSVDLREEQVTKDEAKIVTQGAEIREVLVKYNKGLRDIHQEKKKLFELKQEWEDNHASLGRIRESLDAQRGNLRKEAISLAEKQRKVDRDIETEKEIEKKLEVDLKAFNEKEKKFNKEQEEFNKLKVSVDESKAQVKALKAELTYTETCLKDRERLVELTRRDLVNQKRIIQKLRKGGK